ncbi:hypothetical protein [Xanthomonas vasicola]|uniref:hypothetical protein n=1 Tax=Xanthomonas vasicola TaxID=56459 RepID=UPI0005316244|nr:hypothetical protein [Xanthomonas vasicola]KGR48676.1 hypothetical protein NX07_19995 [Xanthomonas vasicola]KGR51312.1 hypothetical protein NX09_19235 [Xanthomonas vasicola]
MDRQPKQGVNELENDVFLQSWLRDEVEPLAQEVVSGKVQILSSAEALERLMEIEPMAPTRTPKFK